MIIAVVTNQKKHFDMWVRENGNPKEEYIFVNSKESAYGNRFNDYRFLFDSGLIKDFDKVYDYLKSHTV